MFLLHIDSIVPPSCPRTHLANCPRAPRMREVTSPLVASVNTPHLASRIPTNPSNLRSDVTSYGKSSFSNHLQKVKFYHSSLSWHLGLVLQRLSYVMPTLLTIHCVLELHYACPLSLQSSQPFLFHSLSAPSWPQMGTQEVPTHY